MSRRSSAVGLRYRDRVARIRADTDARLRQLYSDTIDPDAIDASFAAFVEASAPVIAAGQAAMSLSVAATVGAVGLIDADHDDDFGPDDEIPGTTKEGKPLEPAMGAWGSMVLGQIAAGKALEEALDYGSYLATRFADAELTGAADRELDRQAAASDPVVGWEGIVSPDACDTCQERNAGVHSLDEEVYRHPGCNCERVPVLNAADTAALEEEAAGLRATSEGAESEVTDVLRDIEGQTGGELVGLEFRLKEEARIAEKILTDVAEGRGTVVEVSRGINDALRYTLQYESQAAYVDGFGTTLRVLGERGLKLVKVKNFWGKPGYQGINGVFESVAGVRFELQFHTRASFTLKAPSHLLFQQLRVSTDAVARARLEKEIIALWRSLQTSDEARRLARLAAAP